MDRSALTGKTFIPSVQIPPLMSDQWKWEKEPEKSSMGTQASRKSTGAPASSLTRTTSPSAGHHRNNSFRTDSGVQVGSSSPQGAWLIPPAIPPPTPTPPQLDERRICWGDTDLRLPKRDIVASCFASQSRPRSCLTSNPCLTWLISQEVAKRSSYLGENLRFTKKKLSKVKVIPRPCTH